METQIHVIAGGPCSGKSTVINALKQKGYHVEEETAEKLIQAGIEMGKTAHELRSDPVQWQQQLLFADHALFNGLPFNTTIFTDTSFIETVVFGKRAGIEMGPNTKLWLQNKRYKRVFFLEPIQTYQQTAVRMESQNIALQISQQIREAYMEYGYELISVPFASVAERLEFIISFLDDEKPVKK